MVINKINLSNKKDYSLVFSKIFNTALKYQFPNLLNISFLIYVFYILDRKISSVTEQIGGIKNSVSESMTAIINTALDKISKQLSQDIKLGNETVIESYLERMTELKKALLQNPELFIQKTSDKTDKIILKMLDVQALAAKNPVQITNVNESYIKPLMIGSIIILALVGFGSYYWVPKIAVLTTKQFVKLQYIVTSILNYIPGSNSATGTVHINNHLYLKIVTEIKSGVATHMITDTRSNTTETLSNYITKLLETDIGSDNSLVSNTLLVVNSLGDQVNIGGLL